MKTCTRLTKDLGCVLAKRNEAEEKRREMRLKGVQRHRAGMALEKTGVVRKRGLKASGGPQGGSARSGSYQAED